MHTSTVRVVNRRAAIILPTAAILLATILGLLAVATHYDWRRLLTHPAVSLTALDWPEIVAAAIITAAAVTVAIATNRGSR